ncbi:hypothetical protein F5888DRAFT_1635221 [Russula emetica]|nr:hypothetical protein F5888DRAFT_1635221 [Russula emetica]
MPQAISAAWNWSYPDTVNLREPGSHRATGGRTLQARQSYAAAARKALSHEHPDGAASASPAASSGQPSRTRECRPLDNRPTARPAAVPRGRRATAQRRHVSEFDVEHNARSRAGQGGGGGGERARGIERSQARDVDKGVADSGSANASAERGRRDETRERTRDRERKRKKDNTLTSIKMLTVMIIDHDDDDALPRRARWLKYKACPH